VALTDNWPTIDPGQFRHQITLLSETTISDASGVSVTWAAASPPVTAWAKIEYLRGTDLIKAGQDVTQAYLKVTMWYRPQFTAQSRIQTLSGNQYIIQAIENVLEMNTYMVLTCLGVGGNN
jgi:SPP1 family predicted phage head-tail adaptor